MEENVALDSRKQKQFVKSIKGIKKLIKKNDTKGVSEKISKTKGEDGKVKKKKRAPRGLVYLGHIPHGFYEHAMTQYFKQFGVVTNARVIRSKRTGNSKGFAFVEFKEPAVAEIVAETMNNYLMGKRLIKAAYIPPEKQKRHAKRKFWSQAFNPTNEARIKMKKAYNSNKDDKGDLQKARKLISNINKTKKKLIALGINYDFFSPVDVPESLVNLISAAEIKEEKKVKEGKKVKENVNSSKGKKAKEITPKVEESKTQVEYKKGKKNVFTENVEKAQEKKQVVKKEKKPIVENKSVKKPVVVNEQQQLQKEKKLIDAGVKSVENFIKIQQDSGDDSDSSYEFNSDEYEKMLSDGDGSDVSGSDEESGSDKEGDTEEDSDGSIPPQLVPAKMPKAVQKTKVQKNISKDEKKPIKIQTTEKKVPQIKRKASQKTIVAPKKSKFENKNTQKLAKKQFKKKK